MYIYNAHTGVRVYAHVNKCTYKGHDHVCMYVYGFSYKVIALEAFGCMSVNAAYMHTFMYT